MLPVIQDGSAAVVAGCCCCGCAVDVVVVDFVVMVVDGTGDDGTGTGNVGNGIDYIMIKSSAMAPATVVSLCVLLYVGIPRFSHSLSLADQMSTWMMSKGNLSH